MTDDRLLKPIVLQLLACGLLLLSAFFVFPAQAGPLLVGKNMEACDRALQRKVRSGVASSDGATAASPDLAAFQAAVPLDPGGVQPWSKLPIRNQCFVGYCWAYALNEFVDGAAQQATGSEAQLITSADHNGFWHLYFQLFNHKQYFDQLAKKVAAGTLSKEAAVREAKLMLTLRPGSTAARKAGFVLQTGSDETTALKEATLVGFVPNSIFNYPLTTEKAGTAFQNTLNQVIGGFLSDQNLLSSYTTTAADGINDDLYNLLVKNLQPYYGKSLAHPPYRPGDTFAVTNSDGTQSTYTPLTYMSQVLKFDPTAYAEVQMTTQNQQLLRQAIHDTLLAPQSTSRKTVPIGLAVFGQPVIEQQGVFAGNALNQPLAGGHEILEENILVSPSAASTSGAPAGGAGDAGTVAQNSWGSDTGITIDGKPSTDPSKTGYYGITWDYLLGTMAQGEPPSFVLPKSILNQAQYSSLQISTALPPRGP